MSGCSELGGGRELAAKRSEGTFLRVMGVSYVMIVVVITQQYVFAETSKFIHKID